MRSVRYSLAALTIFFSFSFLKGDQPQEQYPPQVTQALEQAGNNLAELEKVLANYSTPGDSLKFKAACFLISNMPGHSYVIYKLTDTAKTEISFNILDYDNYDELVKAAEELEKKHGTTDFGTKDYAYDLDSITANLLIENIDFAFKAWNEKPWARELSFDQFCQYVLPYRGSNEPLEYWRKIMWDKYTGLESRMQNPHDPIEAASIINDEIRSWFRFDMRYYYHPTDQGLSEMMDTKMGRCEDMTNLAIYAMRANGLAVTSDYTPYWANTGNNHAWNAIVTPDGNVVPFMGAESNPGEYKLFNKLAKVYRKTFGQQKDNLVFQERKQEEIPGWLAGTSYIDVTSGYIPTADIEITFDKEVPDSTDIAYICVFNSGEWKPIDWTRIANGKANFTDMGIDVLYLPGLYLNKEIVPYGKPFILKGDNKSHSFSPDSIQPVSIDIEFTTQRSPWESTVSIEKTPIKDGSEYEFFYWDDGWQSLGKQTASGGPLHFENIPSNGLYWLTEDGTDKEERIFSIEDGNQVWW
jgi:hypothetical protein